MRLERKKSWKNEIRKIWARNWPLVRRPAQVVRTSSFERASNELTVCLLTRGMFIRCLSFERDLVRYPVRSNELSFEQPRSNGTSNDLTVQTRSNETSNELTVWSCLDCFDFWSPGNWFKGRVSIPLMI